ncbi:hypothetical protein D8674_017562 [Pyrus ussuriensis x Pyrus communis]|uniref:Uncharacterized protein n=1 Tax=Pyrus ussuriensis x Pyrus communis TaxID=2448454 RepID=A0A5N5HIF2_9ROSA|nr:hypothetical protein D8674_017562 [Pyrus ussuriensis x Pyrus communis]
MNFHSVLDGCASTKRCRILSASSSSPFSSFCCRSDFRAPMASEFEPRKSDNGDEDWLFSLSVTWVGASSVNVGGGSAMASKVDDLVVNTAAVTPMRMAVLA